MKRLAYVFGAAALACTAPLPTQAATVIASGAFDAGEFVSFDTPMFSIGPSATNRFEFDVSTPLAWNSSGVLARVTSGEADDFHDGSGFQVVEIDSVTAGVGFQQFAPTRYEAVLNTTQYDYTSISYADPSSGGPDVKAFSFAECCYIDFYFGALEGGTYQVTISPVPEPDAWALMIAGFGVVGASLRSVRAGGLRPLANRKRSK